MSGGGMNGVSSTGFGQPTQTGMQNPWAMDTTSGDTFQPTQPQSQTPFFGRIGNMFGQGFTGMGNAVQGMAPAINNYANISAQNSLQGMAPALTGYATPTAATGNQINDLYQNILGRQPDQAGADFWNQQLQAGTPIGDIRNAMMAAPEAQNRSAINSYYQNILGRPADEAGYGFWMNQAAQGTPMQDIQQAFLNTPEYLSNPAQQQAYGQYASNPNQQSLNAQSISGMYQNLLGRAPDQGGYDFWMQKAAEGVPMSDIRNAIAGAPENVSGRPATAAPIVTQSGGAQSGGALNYQYRRGGIAGLLKK